MQDLYPNFLFVGPDKSGSSWLYKALRAHHQVYLPDVKELFYFDRFYDRGWRWYKSFFEDAGYDYRVIGEISHDYLFSPLACERIAQDLPSVKLMVCLRDPVERAFSAYLYMIKQGRVNCDFETALEEVEELIDHGRYAEHLEGYLETFGRERIHIAAFDDLVADPQGFFDQVCSFLGVARKELPPELGRNVLPAAKPRSYPVARLARGIGWQIRRLGMPRVVNRAKDSRLINRFLYRTYSAEDKPHMATQTREHLEDVFFPEVQRLDTMVGTAFVERWGYRSAANNGRGSGSGE